ncbi:hypothetical protein ACQ4PT_047634 [Festuca glaucescens]
MQDEEVDDQADRLSNLPDDILLNIVERLDTACATRTSILSRRWRQIPAMLSNIVITVGSYDPELDRSKLTRGDVSRANATVHEATRSILEIRTASLHPIHLLCMQFFLGDGSLAIGQAVASAIATKMVESAELALLTHQEGRRCTDDDLLAYGLQFWSFLHACPNIFSGLTRLKLENLRLGESDFTKVFSLSKRLEFLCLFNCFAGILSVLEVEHQQLRELEIFRCDLERVDLDWLPNLTKLTFSCWTSHHDPLSFGYVPLLQAVTMSNTAVSWHKMLKLSEILGNATISELHLNFESEKIWVKPEGPRELSKVLHKLRLVNLADISEECDLAWTLFVLQGAPSLKDLCLTVWNRCEMTWDEEERKEFEFSEDKKDSGFRVGNICTLFQAPQSGCAKDIWISV